VHNEGKYDVGLDVFQRTIRKMTKIFDLFIESTSFNYITRHIITYIAQLCLVRRRKRIWSKHLNSNCSTILDLSNSTNLGLYSKSVFASRSHYSEVDGWPLTSL